MARAIRGGPPLGPEIFQKSYLAQIQRIASQCKDGEDKVLVDLLCNAACIMMQGIRQNSGNSQVVVMFNPETSKLETWKR